MRRFFVCYGINALVVITGAVIISTQNRHGADVVVVGAICAFLVMGVTQYGRSIVY